mmetsp:Transcript_4774/g.6576  ORF Transcript_4774/g.6576 Transcript_4774/m.6576 type:complete len:182 (+) Transcript_4774:54-599(+)|eukprot:CAMPEP_0170059068 /NCGR_PEP_ID=MMETSP0019_2-20121128/1472_1 /TAXON_ID=98059 /ORGANISM="Dinobryon sp., Strain UTEXLB2267" /LENGTH=181 /DNA_ID=CAMNT_0010264201 /DNA_START=69 /DNA_END=614 /DNA_ORIENTATION=-
MIVYRDVITGDEMLSDAFNLLEVKDEEGNVVEGLMCCQSKMISKSDEVDVGCGNNFGGGGGEGEEDAGFENTVQTVNNVIDGFQYTETQVGTANDFKAWIKEYMNAVVLKLREKNIPKEKIQAFKASAPGIAKYFLKRYSDVQFYLGPSFDSNSMVFSIYQGEDTTPTFYYIMGAFIAEKF